MRVFDHIGIPTVNKQPEEMYIEATRVWVTDPWVHPQRIEYLRFEPNSPVEGPVRKMPHVAFQVDDLEGEIEGANILLGPFRPTDTLRVVFIQKDGAIFEYMENASSDHWFRR
jgi:hypothetical protein